MPGATITFPMLGENFRLNPSSSYILFGQEFYWYGAIIAFGFLIAVLYVTHYAKEYGLTSDNMIDMLIIAVPIAVICARLYYVIFNFSEYQNNLLDIINIRKGGLAIYGGVLGGVLGVFIYSKVKKIPMLPVLDVGAFGLLIGQAIGRWGNFINREAFGSETALPWKMGLVTKAGTTYYHPTFLYESCWNILGLILLHFFFKKKRKYDGQIFLLYVAWYGFGRAIIEKFRTDSLFLFGTGIRVSQLLGALSFIAAAALLLYFRAKKPDPAKMFINSKYKTDAANLSIESGENVNDDSQSEDEDKENGGEDIKDAPAGPEDVRPRDSKEEEHNIN